MDRREFITNSLLALVGGKVAYDVLGDGKEDRILNHIYQELPKHVHMSRTVFNLTNEGIVDSKDGQGIIYNGKYITMSHIVKVNNQEVRIGPFTERYTPSVERQNTYLYGQRLREIFSSEQSDVAVFELPNSLHLEEFPAKVNYNPKLGEDVYVIGNPGLRGINIRRGKISRLEQLKEFPEDNFDFSGSFCLGIPLMPGDSGTPVLNSKGELIGMSSFTLGDLGYARKIKLFDIAKYT